MIDVIDVSNKVASSPNGEGGEGKIEKVAEKKEFNWGFGLDPMRYPESRESRDRKSEPPSKFSPIYQSRA